MMNNRWKTAVNYQKKAIRALFPESVNGHLENIEQELKAMAFELVMEYAKNANNTAEKTQDEEPKSSKSKKVDIM